jgi:flavin-binding protein dodecin
MIEHVFKSIELIGTSPDSIEDAVRNAVSKSSHTVHNMKWFEILQIRGAVENNHLSQWQVTTKINFEIDE